MFIHRYIKKSSGNIAKERLKLLLLSDRAGYLPDITDQIKTDIVNAVSKYYKITKDSPEISVIHNEESGNILVARIMLKDINTYNS